MYLLKNTYFNWLTYFKGGKSDGASSKSTELVNLTGSEPGPNLPDPKMNHCVTKINSTTLLFGWGLDYVYYHMNSIVGQWKPGPTSTKTKIYARSESFKFMGTTYVAVVGGHHTTTEFIDTQRNTLIEGMYTVTH